MFWFTRVPFSFVVNSAPLGALPAPMAAGMKAAKAANTKTAPAINAQGLFRTIWGHLPLGRPPPYFTVTCKGGDIGSHGGRSKDVGSHGAALVHMWRCEVR